MASDNDMNLDLGSWSDADYGATVSQYQGIGAEADLPERDRFLVSAAQLLLRRRDNLTESAESEVDDLGIFVLLPSPPESIPNAAWVPMIDDGSTVVCGRLWFASAAVVSGYFIEFPENKDAEQCKSYVSDQLNLGHLPTLVYDPRPGICAVDVVSGGTRHAGSRRKPNHLRTR